jgi:hypothetical protein
MSYRIRCNLKCCRKAPKGLVAYFKRNRMRTYDKRRAARFSTERAAKEFLPGRRYTTEIVGT